MLGYLVYQQRLPEEAPLTAALTLSHEFKKYSGHLCVRFSDPQSEQLYTIYIEREHFTGISIAVRSVCQVYIEIVVVHRAKTHTHQVAPIKHGCLDWKPEIHTLSAILVVPLSITLHPDLSGGNEGGISNGKTFELYILDPLPPTPSSPSPYKMCCMHLNIMCRRHIYILYISAI